MSLSSISIKRPVLAIVMNLFFVIIGVIGFMYLGVRDYPSVDPPIITVSTTFIGASADVIETQITEPLESAINGIPGIRSMSSSSRDGRSNITVEFELEIPMETAANDVRDKVSGAMRMLPNEVDPPVVEKADADAQPIFGLSLSSDVFSIIDVSAYADADVKERLQTIPGVSSVQIWGERKLAIRLQMDPMLLAAYQLTPSDVSAAIARENVELPSGRIEGVNTELTVRTMGRLQTLEDFNNLVISQTSTRVVRFRDIGTAVIDAENLRSILKRDGKVMVNCIIIPQPGSNYIDIVDRVRAALPDIERNLPAGIDAKITFDDTIYIRNAISEVRQTIVIAFCLVVLIIFLFLRDWRTTLIPVLTIPISLIGTFFIMYILGFSINILTLLAIVLSIALVVDDGIVVMENIYQKIESGLSPVQASFKGSKEIFFAVISTTIALVAVFIPIVFLQGMTGRLFREFSLVIACAVSISSFVALSLAPMLCSRILKKREKETWLFRVTEPFFVWLNNTYQKGLTGFLKVRWIAPVFLLIALVYSVFLWIKMPSEMAPIEDRSWLRVSSTAPEGTSFQYMDNYTTELSEYLKESIPEAEMIFSVIGRGGVNSSFSNVILKDPSERKRTQQEIWEEMGPRLRQFTGARTIMTQRQTFGGRRGGMPVEYVIQAKNLDDLKLVLPVFMDKVSQSPAFSAFDVNLRFTKPELTIRINRDKAALLGISVQDISRTLQLTMSEQRIGYYVLNGKQYQIISQFPQEHRSKPSDLENIYVRSRSGTLIGLNNLVELSENSTPPQLFRYDRFVAATVSANPAKGYTLGQGIAEMDRIAAETLDDDFRTTLSGSSKDFVESSSSLLFSFFLALIFIYLALSANFESFRDPFIIMLTVPLALMGALLSLNAFDQTMNIFSQIAMIMLIGLVTKNGILIVEFANQKKRAGIPFKQAIYDAAVSRFRPILMTSLSTVLGILPMALATGAGSESRIAMGVAVVGGMLFATILTLFIIPAIYTYLSSKKVVEVEEEEEIAK
ncbi:MAG: efflux RND transporter permease subunit [Bacteroidetes bacterium]|nr:efflux RND transporter permease subunit [Bacteroidota bacterium]MCL2303310.1 efflux RND transporter permease subunit [Lentimicrobiaceae bacterium]